MKEITLDLETGGTDPLKHALLQIGAYDPVTQSRFNVYIRKPENLEVTVEAAQVNGWPQSHEGKPMQDEATAIQSFLHWLKSTGAEVLICHNAPGVDSPFLKVALSRNGHDPHILPRFGCTQEQARQLDRIGGLSTKSTSLNALIKELLPDQVRSENHDAAEDAYLTWLVRLAMNERFDRMASLANNAVVQSIPGSHMPTRITKRNRFGR